MNVTWMSYLAALDCGKVSDYCAFLIARKGYFVNPANPDLYQNAFQVRYIKRWKLMTPYPVVVGDIKKRYESTNELTGTSLVVDKTGVGEAVVDMIKEAQLPCDVRAYTVTAGNTPGEGTVPKKDLVYSLVSAIQTRRVKVANIPLRPVLEREMEMYRIKVTPNREETFSAFRETDHDDLCIAGRVPVLTNHGWIPIQEVTTSNKVMTRKGWKRVLWSGQTSPLANTTEIVCNNGCVVECTRNHPVFSPSSNAWVKAGDLRIGDEVLTCLPWKLIHGAEGFGEDIRDQIEETTVFISNAIRSGKNHPCSFIGKSGSLPTDPFPRKRKSITSTKIPSTMQLRTWNASRLQSIVEDTEKLIGTQLRQKPNGRESIPNYGLVCRNGILLRKESGNSKSAEKEPLKTNQSSASNVSSADANSNQSKYGQNSVVLHAVKDHAAIPQPSLESADCADCLFSPRVKPLDFAVARVVALRESTRSVPVYNLQVDECPEFFAGGILVHNCFALMLLTWYGESQGVDMPFIPDPMAGKRTPFDNLPKGTFQSGTGW
jgi:hypothetical protein